MKKGKLNNSAECAIEEGKMKLSTKQLTKSKESCEDEVAEPRSEHSEQPASKKHKQEHKKKKPARGGGCSGGKGAVLDEQEGNDQDISEDFDEDE